MQDVSSAKGKPGDAVPLEVAEDVRVGDRVVVAAGTRVDGRVARSKRGGFGSREGQLVVQVARVADVDGKMRTLTNADVTRGTGKRDSLFGPCAFPIPVVLFHRGDNVVIRSGTVFHAIWSSS